MERRFGGNKFGRLDRELLQKHMRHWTTQTIGPFWTGRSFYDEDGEIAHLSYSLAETLVDILAQDFPRSRFIEFVSQSFGSDASILRPLALFAISVLAIIARGDEPQVQQFADPKHPGMLAWKVDYVLPEDAGKPEIELDYDYWDPKLEGDVFSQHRLNSTKINSTAGTLSFVILLSTKESLIALNGKEFRGKGGSLVTDRKVTIASHPALDSGTGGFMLILKPNAKTPPNQVSSYFDLESWVLLTIRFNSD
jgi:hypothetical protein